MAYTHQSSHAVWQPNLLVSVYLVWKYAHFKHGEAALTLCIMDDNISNAAVSGRSCNDLCNIQFVASTSILCISALFICVFYVFLYTTSICNVYCIGLTYTVCQNREFLMSYRFINVCQNGANCPQMCKITSVTKKRKL